MTTTYSINRDGLDQLALPWDLEQAAMDAIDEDTEIGWTIDAAISAKVDAEGWDGDWSADQIVRDVLAAAK